MAGSSKDLKWCIVRLGQDVNWWVEETSDPVHWDVVDGLSLLDPRQINHVIDAAQPLIDYGFHSRLIELAFHSFCIKKDLGKGRVRLERVPDSLTNPTEPLFALPDILDEEKGPYADLLHHLTQARVKMLNDLIHFDEQLTPEELEEEIRDHQNEEYMEGRSVHVFSELMSVLEYVPEGYELEEEAVLLEPGKEGIEEFPDIVEDEESEKIARDETMRWGDEEEEKDELEEYMGGPPEEQKEDDDESSKKKASSKKASAKKPVAKKAPSEKAPVTKKATTKKATKKK